MRLETPTQLKQELILENDFIHLAIRPDLGGRIDQLLDRKTEKNWLWHPPGYDASQSRSLPVGASFDDNWSGGWDEIFPNDAAGEFQGWNLVDHGEFWSQPWKVVSAESHQVKLTYQCQTVPVAVEKTISLHAAKPEAQISYRFENQSDKTIPFLFKQHCAIAIDEGDEILLPDCQIEPAFIEFSKIIGKPGKTRFPKAYAADGTEIDVRFTPARAARLQEFYYSSDLATGECGIFNRRSQTALKMKFDLADFPYVWLFQSYGGWRDFYMLVMEPCTTLPYDLEIASQNGTIAKLEPREIQTRKLTVYLDPTV